MGRAATPELAPAVADVTVLGIGRMGGAMARKLAAAGHQVTVWNRSPAAATELASTVLASTGSASTGLASPMRASPAPAIRIARDPADAVAQAEFVLSVLADGNVTSAVLLDSSVQSALPSEAIVCDLGTSGVAAARAIAAGLASTGHAFVDSPVSGSVATVSAGQLLVMASGDAVAVDAARPVLAAFARQVAYLGPAGAGQAMKLAVNAIVHDLNAALSEALALASRAGIAQADAYDVIEASVVACPYIHYKRDAFLADEPQVAMSLDLVGKDLRLIAALAADLGIDLPATSAVARQVGEACAAGYGPQDMATLSQYVSRSVD